MLNYKKYLAAALAATMVVGSSTIAFAATTPSNFEMSGSDVVVSDKDADSAKGTIDGTGKVEGYVEQEVFKVEVPTIPTGSTLFNFILDPQGLIEATNGAAYNTAAGSNVTFTTGTTMYFKNDIDKAAGNEDYSNKSDYVELKNKGTIDVDASVTATMSDLGDIEMATSNTFAASDDATSIYLALVDNKTTPTTRVLTADAAGVTLESGTIAKSATANYYKVEYADGKYSYELDPAVNATFNSFKFALTGASNPNGDWSKLTTAAPKVKVVWSVVAHRDPAAPSIATTTYANTGAAIDVMIDLGAGNLAATGIDKITFEEPAGTEQTLDASNYSFGEVGDGVLRFRGSYVTTLTATRTLTIVFNDTAKTEVDITLTK